VPLSEDEQRILSEIEEKLYESDPALAREVSQTTVYSHAWRNLKWAMAGFVLGVVLMMGLLYAVGFVAAFMGFLVMLASALWFERSLRRLGRVGWEQMTRSMRAAGLRDFVGNQGQRMRERFRRDENNN
jgi:hypothetical protein